jgi:hypothetical protein
VSTLEKKVIAGRRVSEVQGFIGAFSFKKLKTGKKSQRVSVCQGMSERDFINKSESVASNRPYTRSAFSALDLCIP